MRMYLKNKKKTRLKKTMLITLIMLMLLVFLFYRISNNVSKLILEYSKQEAIKWTSDVLNDSISFDSFENFYDEELFTITKNNSNEIQMIDYNTYMVNAFLRDVVSDIQTNFNVLQENDVTFYIPFGAIFQNVFFNNSGPLIPVKVRLVGSIISNVETDIEEYGINNSLIEMSIRIEVKEKIMLPLMSEEIVLVNNIPISHKIITGTIPSYYGSFPTKNSSIYSVLLE